MRNAKAARLTSRQRSSRLRVVLSPIAELLPRRSAEDAAISFAIVAKGDAFSRQHREARRRRPRIGQDHPGFP